MFLELMSYCLAGNTQVRSANDYVTFVKCQGVAEKCHTPGELLFPAPFTAYTDFPSTQTAREIF
jgi:hypothetical protein